MLTLMEMASLIAPFQATAIRSAAYFTRGTGHDENARYCEDSTVWHDLLERWRRNLKPPAALSRNRSLKAWMALRSAWLRLVLPSRLFKKLAPSCLRLASLPISCAFVPSPISGPVEDFLSKNDQVFVIEMNRDGQLHQLLTLAYPAYVSKVRSLHIRMAYRLTAGFVREAIPVKEVKEHGRSNFCNSNFVKLGWIRKADYQGHPSTLCQGCGHNAISTRLLPPVMSWIMSPENLVKFSGIGCSSKSPTYFFERSLVSMACTGACHRWHPVRLFADHTLRGWG